MGLVAKLRANVTPHLAPGERLEVAFPALRSTPASPFLVDGAYNYAVVATDRRIVVLQTTATSLSSVLGPLFVLDRRHPLGAPSGRLYAQIDLGGRAAWVHRRFWPELRAAQQPAAPGGGRGPAGN